MSRAFEIDQGIAKHVYQAFGLKLNPQRPDATMNIFELFPDTPVRLLRDVFEALQLYDLVELLEKAKPRSLRPALPIEEIKKLRKVGDRPTAYHSQAAVLIVNKSNETVHVEKIKAFFKDLNSNNETHVVSLEGLEKISKDLVELRQRERLEKRWNKQLKRVEAERKQFEEMIEANDSSELEYLAQKMEHRWRWEAYRYEEELSEDDSQEGELTEPKGMREQREKKEKQKEAEIHGVKTALAAIMDRCITNQG